MTGPKIRSMFLEKTSKFYCKLRFQSWDIQFLNFDILLNNRKKRKDISGFQVSSDIISALKIMFAINFGGFALEHWRKLWTKYRKSSDYPFKNPPDYIPLNINPGWVLRQNLVQGRATGQGTFFRLGAFLTGWKLENFSIFCLGFAIFATFQGENWKKFQFLHLTGSNSYPWFISDRVHFSNSSGASPSAVKVSVPRDINTILVVRHFLIN